MKFIKRILVQLILVFPLILSAMDMDDCKIGDTVYIDDWIDKEVKVIDKDYNDKTIKVKTSNGDKKWVKVSELMTKTGKAWEDAGEDILQEIGKSFLESLIEDRNKGSQVKITNNCDEKVRLAIDYKTINDVWKTKYWYTFKPHESNYLSSVRTNNHLIYLYIIGEYSEWKGNDINEKIDGKVRGMRKVNYLNVVLCPN